MAEISTSFNLGGLPYGNHYNFGYTITQYINFYPVVSQHFGYLTTPYIAAVAAEDTAIKQATWSDLTEPIRQQDEIRDKALETLKDILRGYSRYAPEAPMTADADKILRYIKHYNVNPNAQYDRETGVMTNLIQDLEAHCTQEMERLHVDVIVAQMKAANDEVRRLLMERDIEYGGRKHEAVAKARRETDKLYLALRNSVNGYALVDPEGIFTPFINSVNATIKRLNEQVFKIPGGGTTADGETTPPAEGEQQPDNTPDTNPDDSNQGDNNQGGGGTGGLTPDPDAPTGGDNGGSTGGGNTNPGGGYVPPSNGGGFD